MQHYTRIKESPGLLIHDLMNIATNRQLEIVATHDSYGRAAIVRTVNDANPEAAESLWISGGDNGVFIATAIALVYGHNDRLARATIAAAAPTETTRPHTTDDISGNI